MLSPGINGGDLFFLLFLTPFNLIGLGLLSMPVLAAWRKIRPLEAGGVRWRMDRLRLYARLAEFSPMVCGLTAIGAAAFASIFIIGFSTGVNPPLPAMVADWSVVVAVGLGVMLWQWRKQAAGAADLVIDQVASTVELPAISGRKQRETVAIADLQEVEVVPTDTPYRGRGKPTTIRYHVVTLRRRNGGGEKLREWTAAEKNRADEFAVWLREKLGLPRQGVTDSSAAPPR